jgi:hypothetical protein
MPSPAASRRNTKRSFLETLILGGIITGVVALGAVVL